MKPGDIVHKSYSDSTLKSMTKDNLISIIRRLEHNISALQEMNDNQFKMLMSKDERAEKYKWHDLRKNPDDLPTKDGDYMCIVNATKHPERPMTYEPFDLMIEGENKWRGFNGYVCDHFVIAWREREPFEVKDESND